MPRVKASPLRLVNTAVIGVGSNITPQKHIAMAKKFLAKEHRLIKVSPFCKTKPIGSLKQQPDYHNGAFFVRTAKNLWAFKKDQRNRKKGRTG